MSVVKSNLMGKDKNHMKLVLSCEGVIFEAIKFNDSNIDLPNTFNLIVSVNKNEFRGVITPQFLIQEIIL